MTTKPATLKRRALTARHEPEPLTYGQGRGGRPWRRLRAQILERDGYLCQCPACKKRPVPLVAHEVDHIRPISQGGTDDPANLQAINRDCHKAKTAREALEGRRGEGRVETVALRPGHPPPNLFFARAVEKNQFF